MHSLKESWMMVVTIKGGDVVGHTMQYIRTGSVLVIYGANWSEKLLIDCQGNWGNILTQVMELRLLVTLRRLSKFAFVFSKNYRLECFRTMVVVLN
jgi:hypothetical protein